MSVLSRRLLPATRNHSEDLIESCKELSACVQMCALCVCNSACVQICANTRPKQAYGRQGLGWDRRAGVQLGPPISDKIVDVKQKPS